jgi:hypothetical protein
MARVCSPLGRQTTHTAGTFLEQCWYNSKRAIDRQLPLSVVHDLVALVS